MRRYGVIFLFVAVISVFIFYRFFVENRLFSVVPPSVSPGFKTIDIIFKNVTVRAQVADTDFLRTQGLSGRKELENGKGMWFDFGEELPPSSLGFWMKDMNFPIDMIWFDSSLKITFFKENALPGSYPEIFTPPLSGRYVLEVPRGFVQKNGVARGDQVHVQNVP